MNSTFLSGIAQRLGRVWKHCLAASAVALVALSIGCSEDKQPKIPDNPVPPPPLDLKPSGFNSSKGASKTSPAPAPAP